MAMTSTRRAARIAVETAFALWFAVIAFFTFLSDGRLLNLHAAMAGHGGLATLCVVAWATWIAFAAMLVAGPWKRHKMSKRYTLMAAITFCVLLSADGVIPKSTPDWVRAARPVL